MNWTNQLWCLTNLTLSGTSLSRPKIKIKMKIRVMKILRPFMKEFSEKQWWLPRRLMKRNRKKMSGEMRSEESECSRMITSISMQWSTSWRKGKFSEPTWMQSRSRSITSCWNIWRIAKNRCLVSTRQHKSTMWNLWRLNAPSWMHCQLSFSLATF